jgi:hypothetical protein
MINDEVERIWKQREHGLINVPPGSLKVKVEFTLEQATKVHRGSRGIAIPFL